MCMSVPQIAVLATSISTSLCPIFGSGMSSSQMPGAACCLTSAFIGYPSNMATRTAAAMGRARASGAQHAELAADRGKGGHGALELGPGKGGRHLRTDGGLALRHHRIGEADDVHAALEERVGHARGEGGVAEHHRDDRMLAGLEIEAGLGHRRAEEARIVEEMSAQRCRP